eukprot:CAMPEP_0198228994 /NCGR_PEP_ID=MMETSP1445-20131203/113889_1 /TAXON_ID=36898 /ORGANISM="Pyramimonas sp., Strain CCMP2087" /LENGTH=94 /DNA_ID=CAMNT_0043909431 /DNA_START=347 /DNA_END=631 /DNA_ORIENTATION=+
MPNLQVVDHGLQVDAAIEHLIRSVLLGAVNLRVLECRGSPFASRPVLVQQLADRAQWGGAGSPAIFRPPTCPPSNLHSLQPPAVSEGLHEPGEV